MIYNNSQYWKKISFLILSIIIFTKVIMFQFEVSKQTTDENLFILKKNKVVVTAVIDDGASDRAGMMVGDTIIRIDGQTFINHLQADSILRSNAPGKTMIYEVIRNGELKTLYVTAASQAFKFYNVLAILYCLGLIILGNIAVNKSYITSRVLLYSTSIILGTIPILYFLAAPFILKNVIYFLLLNISLFIGLPMIFHSLLLTPRRKNISKYTSFFIKVSYILGGCIILLNYLGNFHGPSLTKYISNIYLQILLTLIISIFFLFCILFFFFGNYKNSFFKKEVLLLHLSWIASFISVSMFSFFGNSGSSYRLFFIVPMFMPIILNYYFFIKKRFFNVDVVVNKSVRYQIVRYVSLFTLISLFLIAVTELTKIDLNDYVFNLTYTGIEVSKTSIEGFSERPFFIFTGIISILLMIYISKFVLNYINTKFSRNEYNYQNALQNIHNLLVGKILDENILNSLVKETQLIMRIKGIALLTNKEKNYSINAISGFSDTFREEILKKIFPQDLFNFTDTTVIANHPIRNLFALDEIQLIVPLYSGDKLNGFFLLGGKNSEDVYNQSDIEFIESVTKQVMILLENKKLTLDAVENEKLHHELQIAKTLQQNLLPSVIPKNKYLDISAYYTAAKEVGGDYYDIVKNKSDDILFVLGDVSGKGISASLYMSRFQGVMRSFIQMGSKSPKSLLIQTNEIVQDDMIKNSFVTCICVQIDKNCNYLLVSRAGHLPLFHYCADSKVLNQYTPNGVALGLTNDSVFNTILEEQKIKIVNEDILLICSDGVTEAMNSNREEFGFENLSEIIINNSDKNAIQIQGILVNSIKEFVGDIEPNDDIAIIVIKVNK